MVDVSLSGSVTVHAGSSGSASSSVGAGGSQDRGTGTTSTDVSYSLLTGTPAQNLAIAQNLLGNANVLAFLHTMTKAEGGSYYATNSGGYTSDLSHFPLTSGAAGAYQIEATTYAQLSAQLGLHDWSSHTQDLMGALELYQTGAVAALENGNLALAIADAAHTWAAVPLGSGNNNHSNFKYTSGPHINQFQPSMDYNVFVNYYHSQGGVDITH